MLKVTAAERDGADDDTLLLALLPAVRCQKASPLRHY